MDLVERVGKTVVALLDRAQKGYRTLRAIAAVLVVVFALVFGSIIGSTIPESSSVVSQAAQSIVGVDGFLMAASGVIAFFYSDKLLKFANPSGSLMVAMRPLVNAQFQAKAKIEFEKSMLALGEKFKLPRELKPEEIVEGQKAVMDAIASMGKHLFDTTAKVVKDMMIPVKRVAYYAAFVLVALVISAFFSTLAILNGAALYLGVGFGFTVLGSGFLALLWSDAHVSLTRFVVSVHAHESMKALPFQPPVQPQPSTVLRKPDTGEKPAENQA